MNYHRIEANGTTKLSPMFQAPKLEAETQGPHLRILTEVVDLNGGFYLFKFDMKEDYHYVFTGGPWIIMNHYLTVRK